MEKENGLLKSKEQQYVETALKPYKIMGRLYGGSSAELFILEKKESGRNCVIKICAKQGVENGKTKLIGELKYLQRKDIEESGMFIDVIDSYYDANIVWYIMPFYKEKMSIHDMIYADIKCNKEIKDVFNDLFRNIFSKEKHLAKKDFAQKRNIQRVQSRMKECESLDDRFKELNQYDTFIINGKEVMNYSSVFDKIQNNKDGLKCICPIFSSLTHDDFTIENVIFYSDGYKLIDPRGVSDTGVYRDYIYDIAKFTLTLGGFTVIKYDMFRVDYHKDNVIVYSIDNSVQKKYDIYYSYVYRICQEFVDDYFPEDSFWVQRLLFTEGCHYLADIACRLYNGDNFDKLIALYAKGLEVLNEFYIKMQLGDFQS